ncbi:transposase [Paraburkholderia sp. BR14374]|uniref:transposase n=1 Tax=Paraburkholderia sp. BR14374 TaxID=3237007 RepID=UPI0034CE78D1
MAKWKVALHDGHRDQPAVHTVTPPQAACLQAVLSLIEHRRQKWGLPTEIGDRRQLLREVLQHRDRMRKLLVTLDCWGEVDSRKFAERLARGDVLCHDGTALPLELQQRLLRECERLEVVARQLAALENARLESLPESARERIDRLTRLSGIGAIDGARLALELFWRQFSNRRQVGACVGLAPQPYDSGESQVDQSISKQGNRRVRALLIEMAWSWNRYQPESVLTHWFSQRTAGTGPNRRARRIAIVAVARRLVIALWRYLKDGVIPEGARLKAAYDTALQSLCFNGARIALSGA